MSNIIKTVFLHGSCALIYKRFRVTKQNILVETPQNIHVLLLLDIWHEMYINTALGEV